MSISLIYIRYMSICDDFIRFTDFPQMYDKKNSNEHDCPHATAYD